MRDDDHQLIQPLYIATFVKAAAASCKYTADGTTRATRFRDRRAQFAGRRHRAAAPPARCAGRSGPLEFFLISLLNGVSYGLLLFMLSSGLTLIFSMMGVLNFAHASFYMLGAYFGYVVSTTVGFSRRWCWRRCWWA